MHRKLPSGGTLGFLVLLLACSACWSAERVFIRPETFIEQSLDDDSETAVLWLTGDLKDRLEQVLGHPYKGLRERYWRSGRRTVWILEELGKVKPITAGFVVEDGILKKMQVLIYRESHGWEVKYPFFNKQFYGLTLDKNDRLSRKIDGISGATLSVNALIRLSQVALILHQETDR